MIGLRTCAAALAVAGSLHAVFAHPIVERQATDIGLTDVVVVQGLGFTYEELTLKDLSPVARSDAKDIAEAFQNFTAAELSNVKSLSFTGPIPDLDQYSTVIAEFDLAVIEKSFLYELTRRKALFRPFKEPIIEAVNAQLEVNDLFTNGAKIFAPRLVIALEPIRESRASSLNKALAAFA